MTLISKRSLLWLGMCLLAGMVSAWAQVSSSDNITYQVTTTPNMSASTGDAEVLGSIRLAVATSTLGTGTHGSPSIISEEVTYFFPGTSCDNSPATGMTLTASGVFSVPSTVHFTTSPAVVNQAVGCYVVTEVVLPNTGSGGINYGMPADGDWFQLDGVRARMEFWAGGIAPVTVTVEITSSVGAGSILGNSSGIPVTYPQTVLTSSVTQGTYLTCGTVWNVINDDDPDDTPTAIAKRAHITVAEPLPFQADFVDYSIADPVGGGPANPRPNFGKTNGSQISFMVYNVPAGVTVTFPSVRHGNVTISGNHADHLVITGSNVVTGPVGAAGQLVEYNYTCTDMNVCDTTLESFDIVPGVTITDPSVTGTISIQVQMNPRSKPTPGGVAAFTTVPDTNGKRPRWSDPLQPTMDNFIYLSPCTTTLLYTWTSNVGGFDTGLVINNTTQDYTNAAGLPANLLIAPTGLPAYPSITPTPPEHGTCTLYFFQQAEAAAMWYTTPDITTGGTWAAMMSSTPFAGNSGYIIARCNFQYAHGFGAIGQPSGQVLNFGQSYNALVIPDPVILSLTIPTYGLGSRLDSNVSVVPNSGESLNQ